MVRHNSSVRKSNEEPVGGLAPRENRARGRSGMKIKRMKGPGSRSAYGRDVGSVYILFLSGVGCEYLYEYADASYGSVSEQVETCDHLGHSRLGTRMVIRSKDE